MSDRIQGNGFYAEQVTPDLGPVFWAVYQEGVEPSINQCTNSQDAERLVEQLAYYKNQGRDEAFNELDAAVWKILDQDGAPVTLAEYAQDTRIASCSDERVAGGFSVVNPTSFSSCVIESAAYVGTEEERDGLDTKNIAFADMARTEEYVNSLRRTPADAAEQVAGLPRRTAHALHALIVAEKELQMPVTAAEVAVYDLESFSAKGTGQALSSCCKRKLAVKAGKLWICTPAGRDLTAQLEERFLRETDAL